MRFKIFKLFSLFVSALPCMCQASSSQPLASLWLGIVEFDSPSGLASSKSQEVRIERTLSIIKPDATRRNLTDVINLRFAEEGLSIVAHKQLQLTLNQAKVFYIAHCKCPFYPDLCEFMASGPIIAQVLEGADAVRKNRKLMGHKNPANADAGTIRRQFGISIDENCVHGSDSVESAADEIAFFFSKIELFN